MAIDINSPIGSTISLSYRQRFRAAQEPSLRTADVFRRWFDNWMRVDVCDEPLTDESD